MENIFNVSIEKRHYKKAMGYSHQTACPLAVALGEKFPDAEIYVRVSHLQINNEIYNISDNWENVDTIKVNNYIHRAKFNKELVIEPILVTLTKTTIGKRKGLFALSL